jgi:hypothetical protein
MIETSAAPECARILVVEDNDVLTEGGIGSYLPRYEDGVPMAE